tara:strand:+ start:138 stop:263 length:126 start_codon:yes stop_codon:yes gene_type:complete
MDQIQFFQQLLLLVVEEVVVEELPLIQVLQVDQVVVVLEIV